jgi:hypothetical protein
LTGKIENCNGEPKTIVRAEASAGILGDAGTTSVVTNHVSMPSNHEGSVEEDAS